MKATPEKNGSTPTPPVSGKAVTGLRAQLQRMVAGIQQRLPAGPSIGCVSAPLVKADVVAEITAGLAAYEKIDQAATALAQARAELKAQIPSLTALQKRLQLLMQAQHGPESTELAYFGLKPKGPRRQLTSEEVLVRNARAMETRKIRGTASKKAKQRLKFRGNVTVQATAKPRSATPEPAAPPESPADTS